MNTNASKFIKYAVMLSIAFGISVGAFAQSKPDKALQLANQWQDKEGSAIRGPNGRVLFVYGQAQPTIVCGLFLICDIAMEPGEFIDTVNIGDSTRWVLNPARVGEGDSVTDHILIKPEEAGLVTSLFVATNRRSYMMKLRSTERDSMGQVGFLYGNSRITTNVSLNSGNTQSLGESELSNISSDMPILPRPVNPAPSGQIITVDPTPVGEDVIAKNLDFEYTLAGDSVPWKPIRVYDDGVKTYIDFNKIRVQAQELPVFLVNDTGSVGAMLMLGKGRKASKVFIYRDRAGKPFTG